MLGYRYKYSAGETKGFGVSTSSTQGKESVDGFANICEGGSVGDSKKEGVTSTCLIDDVPSLVHCFVEALVLFVISREYLGML